jgi:hypothetical protein
MPDPPIKTRAWLVDIVSDEVRLRCSYRRRARRLTHFTVQLEVLYADNWTPVVRYDNAHGFCHRDTLHADGSQHKTAVYFGDANQTFTQAVEDLQATWEAHRARFLREIQP